MNPKWEYDRVDESSPNLPVRLSEGWEPFSGSTYVDPYLGVKRDVYLRRVKWPGEVVVDHVRSGRLTLDAEPERLGYTVESTAALN